MKKDYAVVMNLKITHKMLKKDPRLARGLAAFFEEIGREDELRATSGVPVPPTIPEPEVPEEVPFTYNTEHLWRLNQLPRAVRTVLAYLHTNQAVGSAELAKKLVEDGVIKNAKSLGGIMVPLYKMCRNVGIPRPVEVTRSKSFNGKIETLWEATPAFLELGFS